MTPNDVINEVARIEQDAKLLRTPDSYIQEALLGFVNQTLFQTATVRPDLFAKLGEIPTQPGSVVQAMPADSIRLIEIFHVKSGNSVIEVSHSMMERSYPNWASEEAGTPINYMRHPRNHNRYFLYPAPVDEIELVADYAQAPPIYGRDEEIQLLPAAYMPAIVYGTATLAATVLNDTFSSERASMHRAMYERILGLSADATFNLDSEEQRAPEDDRRRRN